MKLNQVTQNQTEIELGDRTVFFSYSTPVAVFVPGQGVKVTEQYHSVTTSKHINQFVQRTGAKTVEKVPQSFLDDLGNRITI